MRASLESLPESLPRVDEGYTVERLAIAQRDAWNNPNRRSLDLDSLVRDSRLFWTRKNSVSADTIAESSHSVDSRLNCINEISHGPRGSLDSRTQSILSRMHTREDSRQSNVTRGLDRRTSSAERSPRGIADEDSFRQADWKKESRDDEQSYKRPSNVGSSDDEASREVSRA